MFLVSLFLTSCQPKATIVLDFCESLIVDTTRYSFEKITGYEPGESVEEDRWKDLHWFGDSACRVYLSGEFSEQDTLQYSLPRYPDWARELGLSNVVVEIWFSVSTDGSVTEMTLAKSSGYQK
ncbi:hypothetical protein JXM67_13220 [candidate division WOR-3 bacterium]|nr:hypothetical protein [candidate division WOR-3 bacterium]